MDTRGERPSCRGTLRHPVVDVDEWYYGPHVDQTVRGAREADGVSASCDVGAHAWCNGASCVCACHVEETA